MLDKHKQKTIVYFMRLLPEIIEKIWIIGGYLHGTADLQLGLCVFLIL